MKNTLRGVLDVLLYLVIFAMLQITAQFLVAGIYGAVKDTAFKDVLEGMIAGTYGDLLTVSTVISSVLTLSLFSWLKWTPISRNYLLSRPWQVLAWTVLLSIGIILPAEALYEKMQLAVPESTAALFESIMKEPLGYMAIGILAPVVEEMVFRGAVLRTLLGLSGSRKHWIAIAISALLFAVVHGNVAQGVHAFVIGLLLGWMYYRTSSIIPGILLHWVNNTIAYIMFHLMPQMSDGKLIDLFHGSTRTLYMGLLFSLCILIPSFLQLAKQMKKNGTLEKNHDKNNF